VIPDSGSAFGGRELERKIDVLNLVKQIEGMSGFNGWIYGMEAKGKKSAIGSYGLKFKEEERAGEIAGFFQNRAKLMAPIIAPYR
jgi:hypothetical protein